MERKGEKEAGGDIRRERGEERASEIRKKKDKETERDRRARESENRNQSLLLPLQIFFSSAPVDNVDTALEAIVKVALSTATSQHLRLDDLLARSCQERRWKQGENEERHKRKTKKEIKRKKGKKTREQEENKEEKETVEEEKEEEKRTRERKK